MSTSPRARWSWTRGRSTTRRRATEPRGCRVYSIAGHSGAPRSGEPGIHTPGQWLWIPGSLAALGPRNDRANCDAKGRIMTYIAKPKFHHPGLPKNKLGYTHRDYEGKISTLCAGCGHDSITASIIEACFELSIEPHRVAKISGIGCSSKTPDYFLGNSHGFNSVHGRMPSVLTGANLANRDLIYLGVS